MSNFDIELDDAAVRESLRQLKRDYTSRREYKVGSNVEYSVYLEFGTRDMPPYPFVRPAIREFEAGPDQFVRKHTGVEVDEIESADRIVQVIAFAFETAISQNANANAPDRSPGTDPEHPVVQTGTLVNSIQAERIL